MSLLKKAHLDLRLLFTSLVFLTSGRVQSGKKNFVTLQFSDPPPTFCDYLQPIDKLCSSDPALLCSAHLGTGAVMAFALNTHHHHHHHYHHNPHHHHHPP